MIAKAKAIAHGGNAVRYSVDKDKADIIRTNHLPADISPEAMWARMLLHQQLCASRRSAAHPLKNNLIRIELSPAKSESEYYDRDDWARLADDFIREFDAVDLSVHAKRKGARRTNLAGSQYVVALHRDSKSGIRHLHIVANRIDMEGNTNDDHFIHERAMTAANRINARRGWVQSADISLRHRQEITNACFAALRSMPVFIWPDYEARLRQRGYSVCLRRDKGGKVCGYTIGRGNSVYKSSLLGYTRNLMPSKIEHTWMKLRVQAGHGIEISHVVRPDTTVRQQGPDKRRQTTAAVRKYDITQGDTRHKVAIPYAADRIIRSECAVPEDNDIATAKDVRSVAYLLFAGYLAAATSMSASCGGGGGSPGSGWGRDKEEDEREWARRCARMAMRMCKSAVRRAWRR